VVGRAVHLHPIAVLIAVTAGAVLGGVPGALVATPIAAVVARVGQFALERRDEREGAPARA
jgi:predicted PurR-regulated permease PerM